MAHAYTPGLTVTSSVVLQRRRILPLPGSVVVGHGDAVKADTVVARAHLTGKIHSVNAATLLGIRPPELPEYMLKQAGASVDRQEVIAATRPLVKWFATEVRAPITGTLESFSTITGQVLFREPPEPLDVRAFVAGSVVAVHPAEGVTVETACALVQGILGIGGETWGTLVMGVHNPEDVLTPEVLRPDMKGQVVVGGACVDRAALDRARASGVAALIVGGIHDTDLRYLLGSELGVAITGTEQLGLTLVITEGFGFMPMAARTFQLLASLAGREASVSGATQIRAGVQRPEIVVPLETAIPSPAAPSRAVNRGIQPGDRVRIIREPFFGRIGQVATIADALQRIETESLVRVVDVVVEGRRHVTVPLANVERIDD